MTCQQAQDLFSDLHEASLGEALRLKVNQHLHDCPACEHEFASFQRTFSMFEALGPTTVPDDLDEIIARRLDRIDYERKQASPARSGGWFRFAAVGAAAVAVLAVAILWKPSTNVGTSAGVIPVTPEVKPLVTIEKVDGIVRVRFTAKEDTRVDVLEGGTDYSMLPPVDAKQVRVDQVTAGSRYDVPIKVDGPLPQPLWLKIAGMKGALVMFFPQPAALTIRTFEGNTISALQALANGYGVVVEAQLMNAGEKKQHSLQGEDVVPAAKATLPAFEKIALKGGVLHVR